ncbi:MAG: hypothetical protein ACI4K9_07230 [Candidatus Fimenecus sp.]
MLLLLCCGCQHSDVKNALCIPQAFTAKVEITHGAFTCNTDVALSADGTAQMVLTSPEALQSLTVTQSADECSFSFLGIEVKTPETLLPDTAFAKLLFDALQSAKDGTRCVKTVNGDTATYSGMTDAGDTYTLTQSRDSGALLELHMDGQDFAVTFLEFQAE